MSLSTPADTPDEPPVHAGSVVPPDPYDPLPRPLFVRLAVFLAVAGTVLTVGSIGWRWYHVRFPDAVVYIRGGPAAADAVIVVTDEDGRQVFTGRLTAANHYSVVVLVEQGVHTVRADRGRETLVATRLYARNGTGMLVNVVPPEQPPAAATRPAAPAP